MKSLAAACLCLSLLSSLPAGAASPTGAVSGPKAGTTDLKKEAKAPAAQAPGKKPPIAVPQTESAVPPKPAGKAQAARPAAGKDVSKNVTASANTSIHHAVPKSSHHSGSMMVPPPPPETPTIVPFADDELMSILNVPVEYMTQAALKEKRKEVAEQLTDREESLKSKEAAVQEKKDRAQQFISLYQEGVVSRRELETSQAEADAAGKDIERLNRRVSDLKKLLSRIDARLSDTKKSQSPAKVKVAGQKNYERNNKHNNKKEKSVAAKSAN